MGKMHALWALLVVVLAVATPWTAAEEAPGTDPAPSGTVAAEAEAAANDGSATPDGSEAEAPAAPAPIYERVTLANDHGSIELSTNRASVVRFRLAGVHPIELPEHLATDDDERDLEADLAVLGEFHPRSPRHNWLYDIGLDNLDAWVLESSTATSAVFATGVPDTGVVYQVRYRLLPNRPTVAVDLLVTNNGAEPLPLTPRLNPINGVHQDVGRNEGYYLTLAVHRGGADGELTRRDRFPASGQPSDIIDSGADLDYVALKSRFFAGIFTPGPVALGEDIGFDAAGAAPVGAPTAADGGGPGGGPGGASDPIAPIAPVSGGLMAPIRIRAVGYDQGVGSDNPRHQAYLDLGWTAPDGNPFRIEPGQSLRLSWQVTVTSMRSEDLAKLGKAEQRLEYTDAFHRFFRLLSDILTWLLDALAAIPGVGYGLAVILLTVGIKAALHRTTYKQQKSMMAMQKLGPEIKRINEQYKGDAQTRYAKTQELWKKHGVNPLGGCLPIFIQMPIFIALYQGFSHSAELRGESFLWIPDLTLPDQLIYLGNLPIIGPFTLNPLPILYIVVSLFMSFSNKPPQTAAGGQGDQAQQMMKMMRWLPVIFGVIFYNMPSGLVLYFTMSALISTFEMRWIRKQLADKDAAQSA